MIVSKASWMPPLLGPVGIDVNGAKVPQQDQIRFTGPGVSVVGGAIEIESGGAADLPTINGVISAPAAIMNAGTRPIRSTAVPSNSADLVNKSALDLKSPPGTINVLNYATGNNSTDDLPAFKAAVEAAWLSGTSVLWIPPAPGGAYFLNGRLELDYPVSLQGTGAAWFADGTKSVLRFPAYGGIETRSNVNSRKGATSDNTYPKISNLSLLGDHVSGSLSRTNHPVWQATTVVTAGTKIVPTTNRIATASYNARQGNDFVYYYECVVAGTTGGTEPDWQDPVTGFFPDHTLTYSTVASQPVFFGTTVRHPTRWDVAFTVVTPYVYAGSATAAASMPAAFATAVIGDTIVSGGVTWLCVDMASTIVNDGSVTWLRRCAAAIECMAICVLEDVFAYGFLGNMVHIQGVTAFNNLYPTNVDPNAPAPMSIVNTIMGHRLKSVHNGGGIFAYSNDANACEFYGCSILGNLVSPRDPREIGINDQSFLGNYYRGNHISGTGGSAWYCRGAVNASYFSGGNYIEGDCGTNRIYAAATGVGPGGIKNNFSDDSNFHGVAAPGDWRNVAARTVNTVAPVGVQLDAYLGGEAGVAFGWEQASTEAAGRYRLVYQEQWMERGWWAYVYANIRSSIGFSNQRAEEGYGNIRFNNGYVLGLPSDKRFFFASNDAMLDPYVRYSRRVVGDTVQSNAYVERGKGSIERVCVSAGSIGPAWQASSAVTAAADFGPYASGGKTVVPTTANATGYAYECIKSGTTGASEPTWTTTHQSPVARCFPAGGDYIKVGLRWRPSTPNGRIFEVTAVSNPTGNNYAGTEPAWNSLTVGQTIVQDGHTWECMTTTGDSGVIVTDGTAVWQCVNLAKFEDVGYARAKARSQTSNATPKIIDSYPAIPSQTLRTYRVRVTAERGAIGAARVILLEAAWIGTTNVYTNTPVVVGQNGLAGATAQLVLSGSTVQVEVTGIAATTIDWTSELVEPTS